MVAEVITLQLGDYANRVGAHFWNLQDEAIACSEEDGWKDLCSTVEHSTFCSWAEDRHGVVTYCPRTVAVDLSGALGGVSFTGLPAVDTTDAAASWGGHVDVHSLGNVTKSQYRKHLEAAAAVDPDDKDAVATYQEALAAAARSLPRYPKYWTDYLQVDLDPSCVLTLPGVWKGLGDWDGWGPDANSSSSSREAAEAAVDKIRWWAEQCDHLQGLQVLSDDLGGWGNLSLSIITELREQYSGLPMLYYSLQRQQPDTNQSDIMRKSLSQCISLAEVPELASLYVPLKTPPGHVSGSDGSALLAAALDTALLPFRCAGATTPFGAVFGATDMHSLVQLLTQQGANLAAMSLQLPAGQLHRQSSAADGGNELVLAANDDSYSVLAPDIELNAAESLAECVTLRGGSNAGALASTSQSKAGLEHYLLQQQHEQAAARSLPCITQTCISPMPIALPLHFPLSVSEGHPLLSIGQPGRRALGAMTRLTATQSFEGLLRRRVVQLQTLSGSVFGTSCLEQWGYGVGDAGELQESLQHLAGKYSSDTY